MTLLGDSAGRRATGLLVLLAYLAAAVLLRSVRLVAVAAVLGGWSGYLILRRPYRETGVLLSYFLFLAAAVLAVFPEGI